MTEQVEKVAHPKCDHCGRGYYQHIQADGMRLCPVSAFAYRPASSTPPDDSVARIVAGLKERERESLNGHVITGIRLWIESGDWR